MRLFFRVFRVVHYVDHALRIENTTF